VSAAVIFRWKARVTVIEASGLTRRFGDFVAVDDVSLRVPDGTILALLGPNGAGKTTTVRMLAGLLGPTSGNAQVAGVDVRLNPAAVRGRVGLMTDSPGLYEQMKPADYLDFFGGIYGMPREARKGRIDTLLALFDLDAHRADRMAGFSKGMKQKIALARALLHEPAALFLDEPTSGLDPLSARAVRALILDLKHASRSIILCTHDLDEAERLADQVAIVRRGRIVAHDAPAALRAAGSGDTTVRIETANKVPDSLASIAGLEFVRHPIALGDTAIEFRTPKPSLANPSAIRVLVGLGVEIVSVTCMTRSLEDVYIEAIEADEMRSVDTNGAAPALARTRKRGSA
jgi:ABC-2 type transport system ATP-binding protein